ncbi:hypothetical protein MBANPS3_012294 [Mucor bainieri]
MRGSKSNSDKGKDVLRGRFSASKDYDPNQRSIASMFQRVPADPVTAPEASSSSNQGITIHSEAMETELVEANDQISEVNNSNAPIPEENQENTSSATNVESSSSTTIPKAVLENYFDKIQTRLLSEPYPSEYSRGTFWITPKMPFFAIKDKLDVDHIYLPKVFLWVPHLLIPGGMSALRCPDCKLKGCNSRMENMGYNKKPHARRIVDMDSCFYLMSLRYRCLDLTCKKSFNAHDDKFMQQLPMELQMEFPALLTHRGGVSKAVADLYRPCIQNSVGPERFQRILREQHHLKHDRLELQYLISKVGQRNAAFENSGYKYDPVKPFPPFDDENTYAGYVPSAAYFRTLYTSIIESMQPKMDKHMMLLDGNVLKGDHSFKFPKHMGKIEDSNVFSALYTMTNEYEEIVQQALVPSKSLSYLKHALEMMKDAYVDYGHEMPMAFFTDNVAGDKAFLEAIFSSLKEGLQPLQKEEVSFHRSTDEFVLPADVAIDYVCPANYDEIDEKMEKLVSELNGQDEQAAVGFDAEWVVNYDRTQEENTTGTVDRSRFRVDTMQIAYKNTVYVLHIDRARASLPKSLVELLENRQIKKVGRSVGGDLKRIAKGYDVKCKGELELGAFCSARKCIPSGTISLSEISSIVLGARISKDERLSTWDCERLSDEQVKYAAVDAWAGLAIYDAVKSIPVFGKRLCVGDSYLPGTFVALKPPRSKLAIAYGEVAANETTVRQSPRKINVKILILKVPGYVLPRDGNSDSTPAVALDSLGELPINVSLHKTHLVIEDRAKIMGVSTAASNPSLTSSLDLSGSTAATLSEPIEAAGTLSSTCPAAQTAFQDLFASAQNTVDKNGFYYGFDLFLSLGTVESVESSTTRLYSRVVKDIFHLMDMIKPYKKHGLYDEFTRKFSESLFTLDEEDVEKVTRALISKGESWESKLKYERSWVLKRVKRRVADPPTLIPILKALFLSLGPLKDSNSGRALFDKVAWKQAHSVLKIVQQGHASDPPGVQLYYKTGRTDSYGLPVYRCIRGTNSLEGGVHQNLIRKFGSFGAGPELANAMLTDYRLRHNLDVGTVNRLGREHKSHYDPWLVQHIDLLRRTLGMEDEASAINHIGVDINALNYRGSNEVFGICPLPDAEMQKVGIAKGDIEMLEGDDKTIPKLNDTVLLKIGSTLRAKNARYHYVARKQRCQYAVLAIHTFQEIYLFKLLLSELSNNNSNNRTNARILNFETFALEWNAFANGEFIFYKTPEQIEQYYNQWKDQESARKTHVMHVNVIKSVETAIEESRRQDPIAHFGAVSPTIPSISLNTNNISTSDDSLQLSSPPSVLTVNNGSSMQPQQQQQQHLQHQLQYLPAAVYYQIDRLQNSHGPRHFLPVPTHIASSASNRQFQPYPLPSLVSPVLPSVNNRRRLCKGCGESDCNGKNNRAKCRNPRCLKCGRSEGCEGIWETIKCSNAQL